MENRAPLLSSIFIAIVMMSCHSGRVVDIETVSVSTSRGITRVNDTIFTGTLVRFYAGSRDTMTIASFNDGREHGTWKTYHAGNTLAEVRQYDDGKKTGIYRSWYGNGQIRAEYHYANDEYHGLCQDWSADGQIVRRMNYKNGYESGMQQLWDDDGAIRANYVAKNGRNYGLTGVKSCATIWKSDSVRVH